MGGGGGVGADYRDVIMLGCRDYIDFLVDYLVMYLTVVLYLYQR